MLLIFFYTPGKHTKTAGVNGANYWTMKLSLIQKNIANQTDKGFTVKFFKRYSLNFNYVAGIVNSSSISKPWLGNTKRKCSKFRLQNS